LTAWLLQLLDERATYGYQLHRELEAHGVSIDAGTMYRSLGKLEEYGWVQSRWMRAVKGPRRRLYRLTPKGRRMLDEIACLIDTIHATYQAFVLPYDTQRPQPATISGGDVGSYVRSTSEALRPGRKLLTAWLLVLLDRGESYGYDLGRRLAQARVTIQPSALYRRLRTLERQGCLASHWGSPIAGPRRRVYALTRKGERDLDELAARIRAARGAMNTFLQAHDHARTQRPQTADGGGELQEHLQRHR
jgi:PadR family transcriptional regulator PadR